MKSASLTYFNFFGLDVPSGISAPNRSNLRCGAHKDKNSSLRIRTATPPGFLWVFGSPGRWTGYSRDKSEGEGPRLLRLAEHLKFGSLGEIAKHFLAFRPQAPGYVSRVFVSVGREMILPSDLLA